MARRKPWRRDLKGRWHGASRDGGIDTPQPASAGSVPQFTMVVPRLRTVLAFSGPVFRIFAPPSPVSPAHSPLAARGYGPAYFRASPSKLPGPSRPLASLTAARCSGAADALWACPRASSRFAAFDCALRVLATSALRASDVRKLTRGFPCLTGVFVPACASLARYSGAAERFALSSPLHPFGASTAAACFAHRARASCAPFVKKEPFD